MAEKRWFGGVLLAIVVIPPTVPFAPHILRWIGSSRKNWPASMRDQVFPFRWRFEGTVPGSARWL